MANMETTAQTPEWQKSWLWPDHVIGKRESRQLRTEHNKLVTAYSELAEAVQDLEAFAAIKCPEGVCPEVWEHSWGKVFAALHATR